MMTIIDILTAIAPPAGLAILFTVAIRAIVHADRRERQAQAQADAMRKSERADPGEPVS